MIPGILKALSVTGLVITYLLGCGFIHCLFLNSNQKRNCLARWTQMISGLVLEVLGIVWSTESESEIDDCRGSFIVSNHLSYIDILLISSLTPTLFVTSREVKDTPILGLMATLSGALFVDRQNPRRLLREIAQIQQALSEGHNVVVFPEATSTDGSRVLPFKPALFESAIRAKAPVFPIAINYRSVDGLPVTKSEANTLFYYGEMNLLVQLCKLLCVKEVWVELSLFKSIRTNPSLKRNELARNVWNLVQRAHISVPMREMEGASVTVRTRR